mgnify:CR=1 FL=1
MIETDWLSLISNVGFPIAMVAYFIFRMERIIKDNTLAIQQLQQIVSQMKGGLNHGR